MTITPQARLTGNESFLLWYDAIVHDIERAMRRRFPFSWTKEKTYLVWVSLGEEFVP